VCVCVSVLLCLCVFLMLQASPPKFINVEDVMRLASGVNDMALAHEIAVSGDFRLEQIAASPNR